MRRRKNPLLAIETNPRRRRRRRKMRRNQPLQPPADWLRRAHETYLAAGGPDPQMLGALWREIAERGRDLYDMGYTASNAGHKLAAEAWRATEMSGAYAGNPGAAYHEMRASAFRPIMETARKTGETRVADYAEGRFHEANRSAEESLKGRENPPTEKRRARIFFAGKRGWVAEALTPYYMATRVVGSGRTIGEARRSAARMGYEITHIDPVAWDPDDTVTEPPRYWKETEAGEKLEKNFDSHTHRGYAKRYADEGDLYIHAGGAYPAIVRRWAKPFRGNPAKDYAAHYGIGVGTRVKKRRPFDGRTGWGGQPFGPWLRVVELKDTPSHLGGEMNAVAKLEDGSWAYVWNLWSEEFESNPSRPPSAWMKGCMAGVGPGYDPGSVCGSQWYHKMTPAQRRRAVKEYEGNPKSWKISVPVNEKTYFDVADGLYWFAMQYHSGGGSVLYRVGSGLGFKPGPLAKGPEGEVAQQVYDELAQLAETNYRAAENEAERLQGHINRVYGGLARNPGPGWHEAQAQKMDDSARAAFRAGQYDIYERRTGGSQAHRFSSTASRALMGNPNDRERELWVMNDEGLYRWWRSSGLSKQKFIRENRAEIDAAISRAVDAPPRWKQWYDYNPGAAYRSFPDRLLDAIGYTSGVSDWQRWGSLSDHVILNIYDLAMNDRVTESARKLRDRLHRKASHGGTVTHAWKTLSATDVGEILNTARRERGYATNPEPRCPECDGPGVYMGSLGKVDWYRCRNCGADFQWRRRNPGATWHYQEYLDSKRGIREAYPESKQYWEGAAGAHWQSYKAAGGKRRKNYGTAGMGRMKITAEDFNKLAAAVEPFYTPERWEAYRQAGLSETRFLWDALWKSRLDTHSMYTYLNDNNIHTALKAIAKRCLGKMKSNPRRSKARKNPKLSAHEHIQRAKVLEEDMEYAWETDPERAEKMAAKAERHWEQAEKLQAAALPAGRSRRSKARKNLFGVTSAHEKKLMKIKGFKPWMLQDREALQAVQKYVEFHGCWPTSVNFGKVTGVKKDGFLVNMGKAMDTTYVPTKAQKGSNKYGSGWIHEFNEGKKGTKDLPDRFCTPDGKTIVTAGGKFKVKDWVRG